MGEDRLGGINCRLYGSMHFLQAPETVWPDDNWRVLHLPPAILYQHDRLHVVAFPGKMATIGDRGPGGGSDSDIVHNGKSVPEIRCLALLLRPKTAQAT